MYSWQIQLNSGKQNKEILVRDTPAFPRAQGWELLFLTKQSKEVFTFPPLKRCYTFTDFPHTHTNTHLKFLKPKSHQQTPKMTIKFQNNQVSENEGAPPMSKGSHSTTLKCDSKTQGWRKYFICMKLLKELQKISDLIFPKLTSLPAWSSSGKGSIIYEVLGEGHLWVQRLCCLLDTLTQQPALQSQRPPEVVPPWGVWWCFLLCKVL